MKKITFVALFLSLVFSYCGKNVDNTGNTPFKKYLFAVAGSDTTICMPFSGTGNVYNAILDGRGSHDGAGKIVSYVWNEKGRQDSHISSPDQGLTDAKILGGLHQFTLEVRDDHGRIDMSTVTINVLQNFYSEYDGLSWDSTTGGLATISVKIKPGLIQSWPDFFTPEINVEHVYLNGFNGECSDFSSWKELPYVAYGSIQQTAASVFYTLIATPKNGINNAALYPEIFAKTNSGIDLTKKVSLGFTNNSWDY
jgi:hypothetical protein